MPRRRRRKALGQRWENIERFHEIRRHIRDASHALDRKRCIDASMHLQEARDLMKPKFDPGRETREWYEDEKARLQTSCRVSFGAHRRRRARRR